MDKGKYYMGVDLATGKDRSLIIPLYLTDEELKEFKGAYEDSMGWLDKHGTEEQKYLFRFGTPKGRGWLDGRRRSK